MIESHIYKKGLPKGFYKVFKDKNSIAPNVCAMFAMICNKLFKWEFENKNAKQEIDSYIIEKLLFENGRCLFFEEGGHYFITLIAERGQIDAVGRLVKARPITLDGTIFKERIIRNIVKQDKEGNITIEKPNAVIIKNNLYDLATLDLLAPFINTLNYVWQTMQINLSNSRVKRFVVATDNNQANILKKEIESLVNDIDSVKVITDKKATEGLKTLDAIQTSEDIKTTKEVYDWLYNWLLCYLGINNMAQIDKQSGMTEEEINSNKSQTTLFLESMADFRKKAVEEINAITDAKATMRTYQEMQQEEIKKEIIDNMTRQNEQKDVK